MDVCPRHKLLKFLGEKISMLPNATVLKCFEMDRNAYKNISLHIITIWL